MPSTRNTLPNKIFTTTCIGGNGAPGRRPSAAEINKMNKEQLKTALTKLIGENTIEAVGVPEEGGPLEKLNTSIKDLSSQMKTLQDQFGRVTRLIEEVDNLKKTVKEQGEIIAHQQRFMEMLDNKERERNLVVTGVSENETLSGDSNVGR